MTRLLIINPNSTQDMTNSLEFEIKTLNFPSSTQVDFYTGPLPSPPSINNHKEAIISSAACISGFQLDPDKFFSYDGYLVCCYSDHPLVNALKECPLKPGAVVMGIFQASIIYAMNYASADNKVSILTSGVAWEELLDSAILKFFGTNIMSEYFVPTLASGLGVLELHEVKNYNLLKGKIQQLADQNVSIVLLGCAGLSTLNNKMKKDFPNIKFVDSVKVGARLLSAYVDIGDI